MKVDKFVMGLIASLNALVISCDSPEKYRCRVDTEVHGGFVGEVLVFEDPPGQVVEGSSGHDEARQVDKNSGQLEAAVEVHQAVVDLHPETILERAVKEKSQVTQILVILSEK